MEIRKKILCIILGLSIIPVTFGQSIKSELDGVLSEFIRLCDNFSHVELVEYMDELKNFFNQQDKRVEIIDDNGIIYYVNDFMVTAGYNYGEELHGSAGLGVQCDFYLYKNNVLLLILYVITPKEEQRMETIRNSSRNIPIYLFSLYPNGTYSRSYYLFLEEGQIVWCNLRKED